MDKKTISIDEFIWTRLVVVKEVYNNEGLANGENKKLNLSQVLSLILEGYECPLLDTHFHEYYVKMLNQDKYRDIFIKYSEEEYME